MGNEEETLNMEGGKVSKGYVKLAFTGPPTYSPFCSSLGKASCIAFRIVLQVMKGDLRVVYAECQAGSCKHILGKLSPKAGRP